MDLRISQVVLQLTTNRAQISYQVVGRLISLGGVLRQRFKNDGIQVRRQRRINFRRKHRLNMNDIRSDLNQARSRKCRLAGNTLIEHAAQPEQIAARVNLAAHCLFG